MSSMKFPTQSREQVRPDRAQIAAEAFKIWESEGCPEGRAEAHWHQAEQRLAAQASNPRAASDRASSDRAASPARRGV